MNKHLFTVMAALFIAGFTQAQKPRIYINKLSRTNIASDTIQVNTADYDYAINLYNPSLYDYLKKKISADKLDYLIKYSQRENWPAGFKTLTDVQQLKPAVLYFLTSFMGPHGVYIIAEMPAKENMRVTKLAKNLKPETDIYIIVAYEGIEHDAFFDSPHRTADMDRTSETNRQYYKTFYDKYHDEIDPSLYFGTTTQVPALAKNDYINLYNNLPSVIQKKQAEYAEKVKKQAVQEAKAKAADSMVNLLKDYANRLQANINDVNKYAAKNADAKKNINPAALPKLIEMLNERAELADYLWQQRKNTDNTNQSSLAIIHLSEDSLLDFMKQTKELIGRYAIQTEEPATRIKAENAIARYEQTQKEAAVLLAYKDNHDLWRARVAPYYDTCWSLLLHAQEDCKNPYAKKYCGKKADEARSSWRTLTYREVNLENNPLLTNTVSVKLSDELNTLQNELNDARDELQSKLNNNANDYEICQSTYSVYNKFKTFLQKRASYFYSQYQSTGIHMWYDMYSEATDNIKVNSDLIQVKSANERYCEQYKNYQIKTF